MAIDDTSANLGKDYILTEDIDMGGETWTPIGIFESTGEMPNEAKAFHGTFDGNGKTIVELKIDGAGTMGAALFGVVANGTVKDLTIENASVTGNCMAAAAVGYAYQSTIDNVDLSGTNTIKAERTSTAPSMVSGIVGASIDSTIQNCNVIGTTLTIEGNSAASMVGSNAHDIGLMGGGLEGGSLKECTAVGKIICDSDADFIYGVGGLAGCMMSADSVTSCSANVEIKLGNDAYLIGGLLGYTGTTGDAAASAISGCSAEGSIIAGGTRIGQLLGGGFYMPSTVAYYPLPTRFTVSESSAATTGADAESVGQFRQVRQQ